MNEKETLEEFLAKIPEEQRAEFQSVVDRERTNASVTARKNAELALASDEKFLASLEPKFKEKFEKEQNQTEEQRKEEFEKTLREKELSLKIKENTMSAKEKLMSSEYGLGQEEIDEALKLIVDADENVTKTKLEAFTKVLSQNNAKKAEEEKKSKLKSFTNPQGTNTGGKDEIDYKAEFQKAREKHDYRRMGEIARLAGEKNISLR